MRLRPEQAIGLVLLAVIAIWPFRHEFSYRATSGPLKTDMSPKVPAPNPETSDSASGATTESSDGTVGYECSGCDALRRLARRLKAREEGAARRFETAANALAKSPPRSAPDDNSRRQLELALRRAQDDKRGAAAFRAATLAALEACRRGPGCGEAGLADYWEGGCPPEHPDLARETKALAKLSHAWSRKVVACAAAACPNIDCARQARTIRTLSVADRSLTALRTAGKGLHSEFDIHAGPRALSELMEEAASWRSKVAALFLGGSDPVAQIAEVAEQAASLAERLRKARAESERMSAAPAQDPFWRVYVLATRLKAASEALNLLSEAVEVGGAQRDAMVYAARERAAETFRDLIITQMRIRSARESLEGWDEDKARTCGQRRRRQIDRAQAQIRTLRAALSRCAVRAACARNAKKERSRNASASGLDPVSAARLRFDLALGDLNDQLRDFTVKAQKPVRLDTVRTRYQTGEAVSVRIDLGSTACMAEPGAWVGLFPQNAPKLRSVEAAGAAVRRRELRGRPWEELFFEAPQRPGDYEVRAYTSRLRGGSMTGAAKFAVMSRAAGCSGFTGTWSTNFGRLQITVRDGEARGSYKRHGAFRAGFLIGEVKGRVLRGQWQSELGGGGTRLVLSEDGKSFKGTWSHFRDEFTGTGVWRGTCETSVTSQPKSTED